MLNIIKADFYKLFRMKSYYICGLIGVILSLAGILMTNSKIQGFPLELLGYSGVTALIQGVSSMYLFYNIFISLFVSSEFSFGTIKNVITSGQSRMSIYLSKIVIGIFTVTSYVLLSGIACWILGNMLWGAGNIARDDFLKILRMLGLFIFAETSMQCLFIMIGFLIRKTGGTVATNILIPMFIGSLVVFIDILIRNNFGVNELKLSQYCPWIYPQVFSQLNIVQEDLIRGLIVCAVSIIIFTALGIWSFIKRDIKE